MTRYHSFFLPLLFTLLQGCGHMQYSAKLGDKTLAEDEGTRAQNQASAEERARFLQEVANAPKRSPQSPIVVALKQPNIEPALQQNFKQAKTEGMVFNMIRKDLAADPVIRLVDEPRAADIVVDTSVHMEQLYGVDKRTHKAASMPAFVVEGDAESVFADGKRHVKAMESIFRNEAAIHAYAAQLKDVIKNQLGGTIPANADKYRSPASGNSRGVRSTKPLFKIR